MDELKELTKTAKLLKLGREKKKQLKGELEVVQANIDSLEESLYDQLEYADLQSIRTESGTFFKRDRLRCSCEPERKEDFYEFLRTIGAGDLVYETINHNNLASWAKERIKEGRPLPSYLNISTVKQVGFRK